MTSLPAAAVASLARQSIVARTRCRLFCDVDALTRFCVCRFVHCAVVSSLRVLCSCVVCCGDLRVW